MDSKARLPVIRIRYYAFFPIFFLLVISSLSGIVFTSSDSKGCAIKKATFFYFLLDNKVMHSQNYGGNKKQEVFCGASAENSETLFGTAVLH